LQQKTLTASIGVIDSLHRKEVVKAIKKAMPG
jgi:hypothetical protein